MTPTLTIDLLAQQIYNQNIKIGWWDDPDRCIYTTFQLISTEIAEATEGERKNLMDDHLPHRKMGEVELADAAIRLLDLAGKFCWSYVPDSPPHRWTTEPGEIGKRHLGLNDDLIQLAISFERNPKSAVTASWYSSLLNGLIAVSDIMDYDLWGAIKEKDKYNATRADHKRENRAKENGKKF